MTLDTCINLKAFLILDPHKPNLYAIVLHFEFDIGILQMYFHPEVDVSPHVTIGTLS